MSRTGNFGNGFFGRILLLVCFACGLTACQVGLGAAVDTSDPRAGVLIPDADHPGVGGPTIHIAGTCEDDSGIAEIKITQIRKTDGTVEYNDLGNAELSADGRSWSFDMVQAAASKSIYVVNGRELTLKDGRYQIIILPVDNGGRSPRYGVEKTIEIDNTPPFFLISSPSTVYSESSSEATPYGQTVKIKGSIYDYHEVKNLSVAIYDGAGTPKTIQVTDDMARVENGGKDKNDFQVLLAKKQYPEDSVPDEKALSNYTVLYPNGSSGDKKYYMELELEDMTNYGTDLPGNKNDKVYFRSLLFEKIKEVLNISNFNTDDLIPAYNGTHSSFTEDQCEKIRSILDGTYDDDTSYYAKVSEDNTGRLVFSVNPNNTPKYSFGGMSFDDASSPSSWTGRGAAGGSISLSVTSGSDEYLVKPSTIHVTLQAVNASGAATGSSVTLIPKTDTGAALGDTGVESATYIVTLPDEMNDTYYKLTVTGTGYRSDNPANTESLQPVKSAPGGYGFMMYSNKIPVTITSEEDLSYVKKLDSNSYSFAIKVSDPNSPTTIDKSTGKIKYQIQTSQGYKTKSDFTSTSWSGLTINTIEGTTLGSPVAGIFSKTISGLAFTVDTDKVGTIALRIWGDNGVESDKNVYLLYVDNRKPEITVINENELGESKQVTKNSPYYSAVDGTYTISGTWQDVEGSGVKDLQYSLDGTNYVSILDSPYSSRVTDKLNWSKNIPVTEGSNKSFYIKAIDLVDNATIKEYEGIEFDFTEPELESLKYMIGDGNPEEAVGIVAVNEKTLTLWGTYSDTCSGVKTLGFAIGSTIVTPNSLLYTTNNVNATNITDGGITWEEYNSSNVKNIKGWKATFDKNKFGSGGALKITGTDIAGNSTAISSITLRKDNTKPTVSNISIVGAYKKNDTTYYVNNEKTPQITIKGVSSDDYSLKDTTITIPGLSPITVTGTSWQEDNVNISGLTDESVTITIKSSDTAGNESVATNITLNFDKVAPSRVKNVKTKDQFVNSSGNPDPWGTADNWSDSSFTVGGGVYYAESYSGSTSLRINGQFSESGSGISAVYYEIVNGETALSLNETNYNSFNSIVPASDGKFTTMLTGLQEGNNNLRLIAVDNVGNVSKITDSTDKYESDFVLGLDQTAPVFGNGFALNGSEEYVTGSSNFTISGGSVSDDRAGVNPGSIKFWFVNKDNSSIKYEMTRTAGTYGQVIYTQTDPTDSNLSANITINVTPGSWFTEENLGTSPILYGSMTDYSNPANSSGTVTILTTLKLDHKEPEIEIDSNLETTPITDENANGKIKKVGTTYYYELTGSWSDTGSGTNKLFYATDGGATDGSWHDADDLGTDSSGEKNYNYAKSKAESTWSLKIPVTEGSPYNFAVKAVDVAGNIGYDKPNKTVTFDFTKPTVSVNLASGTYGASLPTGITRDANNRPTVTITAQDHYKVKATGGITVTTSASASDYTLSGITFADDTHQEASQTLTFRNDGEFEFTFTATDENGRTSDSVTRTWIVDTVSPAAKADNDSTYGLKINGAAAKEWYRDTNLKFDGFVDEKVSGLKTVYYLVDETEGVTTDYVVNNGNQQNYAAKKNNGSIPVEYSGTPTVPTGTSYVHMVFEDVAGNRSAVKNITIKIDKTTPTFGKRYYSYEQSANYNEIEGNVLSNGANDLYIVGSYSDSNSGVDELAFYISGTKLTGSACEVKYSTVDIAADGSNIGSISSWQNYSSISDKTSIKSYRAKIAKSSSASGGAVDAEPKDVAGNGSTQTIFTIAIDNQAPVLTLNTPKTKCVSPSDDETVNTVNGTITFAGSTEESSMDKLELYWGTSSSATADIDADHLVGTKTGAQSYNWSFSVSLSSVEGSDVKFIDGTSYSGSTKDIYLKLIATDKAGNTAKYVYKYIVNPDDDRPIITFTQLDLSGLTENEATSSVWLKDNKTMTGSVTDDDGVSKLEYRKKTYDSSTGVWSGWTNWEQRSVTNGNFTIPFTDETKYSLEFKVKDGAGTEFTTVVGGTQYLAPKFVDLNGANNDYSILNLAVDITSPNISDVKYIANNGADEAASTDFTLNRFGGDWKKFKLQFDAADNNGIKSAKVIFNGKEYTATNTSGHTYSTGYIPLDKVDDGSNTPLPSGNYTATIIATDNADREGRDSMKASFVVDNDAPTVRISQPNGLVSMATQAVGSLSEVNGLAHVYFMVTQKNANPVSVNDYATAEQNGANRWKEYANLETGTSSFEIAFDSGNGDNHTDLLKWYLAYVGLTTIDAINGTNGATRFTDLTEIDLHIKAVDSYGNVGYGRKTVQVDPQGDKPTVTITYPLADSTLGGAIPIMGTAIDNVSADNVMVLIDMNYDGKWNKADIDAINALTPAPSWRTWGKFDLNPSTEKYEWTDLTYTQIISETSAFETNDVRWTKYGIKRTVNNASWSFTANQGGELNPTDSARRNIAIWVYSTDTDGNSSQINLTDHTKMPYVSFIIDKDTPQITNEYLVQYDNSGVFTDAHVTAKYAYTKDMSIKGEWYYETDMTDESGLEKVTRYTISDGASIDSVEMTSAGTYVGGDIVLSEITNGYHIRMKVGSNTDDEVVKQNWKIACQESDGQHLSGESEIVLNVDNKKPDVIEEGDFYNMGQAFTIAGHDYRKVTNENGFFTFGTQAKEDAVDRVSQTGVKRIAFYFTRDINTTHQLYDVMIKKGSSGNAVDGYSSLTYEDGLYWKSITGSPSGENSFTLSAADSNVHAGGLVKIKGVIYRIDGVSGNVVSVEANTTGQNPFSGVSRALFALANVVDNLTEENADETSGKTAGYYNHVNFDDGDLMVESLKKQGTTWTWEANINSKNIGDGKAVLHYVVFDAAGNTTPKTVDVFVANNQPRIAGVSIGTDTNGNGIVDDSEMISEGYTNIYAKGKQGNKIMTEAWFPSDKASSVLKIIGNTKIKPEIVGGNGRLDYSYAAYLSNGAGSWGDTPLISGSGTNIGTGMPVGTEDGETEDAQALTVDFTMAKLLGMGNSQNTKFALTVSDQAPGSPLTATLNIIVDTLLLDNNAPKSHIIPFYWVNGTKNSLFMDSRDYGHIELPVDLPDSFTEGGTGVDDRDPKLSGIVKIEGIARDDVLLSELKVKVGANEYTIGSYDGAWTVTNEWDGSTIPTDSYAARITKATYREAYNMGFITPAEFNDLDDTEKDSAIDYVTAKYGHIVHWTLYLDTASFVTGTDIAIMASASDRGMAESANGVDVTYNPNTWTEQNEVSHSASASVSDSGTPTGYQKVDVVPYIAKVYTGLGKLKSNNWSVYNRTALGHYAVASDETVYLYGFNLGDSTEKPKYGAIELNAPVNGGVTNASYPSGASYASYSVVSFPVSNMSTSGEIAITVGEVTTLNNINKTDAKGSYTGTASSVTGDKDIYDNYYNRQPNGDNNNLLTDDIVLDVWEIDPTAVYPMRKKGNIAQAVMKINPVTDQLGFAFANAAAYFSMPGKTVEAANDNGNSTWNGSNVKAFSPLRDYSYTYWNGELEPFTSVGFTYDKYGYSYGVASGGDINSGSKESLDFFSLMTDRWGKALGDTSTNDTYGRHQSSKHDQNSVRFETNGLKENDASVFEPKRIKSPSIVVSAHGENDASADTNVYLAYFDVLTSQIRFRAGNIGEKLTGVNSNNYDISKYYKLSKLNKNGTMGLSFYSIEEDPYWNIADGNRVKIYTADAGGNKVLVDEYKDNEYVVYNLNKGNKQFALLLSDSTSTTEPLPLYDTSTSTKLRDGDYYIQLVPEKSKGFFGNFKNVYGTETKLTNSTFANAAASVENLGIISEGITAGEYLSMGVIPKGSTGGQASDDVLVIVWYGDDLKLHYAYNTTPSTIPSNGSTTGWTSTTLFTGDLEQAGEYCQLAVDANGGIHIAVLDSTNSDLIYAYIENYNEPGQVKTCIVDSSGIVGDNLTIDVALDNSGKAIPRISYYNSSSKRPKLAYLVDTTEVNPAGARDDAFTGKWECSVIPTSSKIDLSDTGNKINVGVWKDSAGIVKNSTATTKIQSVDWVKNYYSTSYGIVGGNGTANPVLGYIIKKDSTSNTIETAQMK